MTLSSSAKSIIHMIQNFIAHVQMKVFFFLSFLLHMYSEQRGWWGPAEWAESDARERDEKKIHKKWVKLA